jgi:hypothetical protein
MWSAYVRPAKVLFFFVAGLAFGRILTGTCSGLPA